MTDKVQKIREEVERLKEETSIGLSEYENGVERGRMEIINALSIFLDTVQEEPASRTPTDIEVAMQEVKEKSMAFTEAHQGEDADTILAQMRGEEPVSEDLEKAADKMMPSKYCWSGDGETTLYTREQMKDYFKTGANWQKRQMEKFRIEHCTNLTNEQVELEQEFVLEHLNNNNRMPTFLDAIEYGAKRKEQQMMKVAVDGLVVCDEQTHGYKDIVMHIPDNLVVGDKVKLIIIKED